VFSGTAADLYLGYVRFKSARRPTVEAKALRVRQVVVFWVATPCSDVVGYRRFEGHCCVHLQGETSYDITESLHASARIWL
jgi:hypothetical protein